MLNEFFSDTGNAFNITKAIENKMYSDVSNNNGQTFGTLKNLDQRGLGWIGSTVSALVNASPIIKHLRTSDIFTGEVFGPGIGSDDVDEAINVQMFKTAPSLPGASLAISLKVQPVDKDDIVWERLKKGSRALNEDIIPAYHHGGEVEKKEGEGETLVFNANRGQEATRNLEEKLSEVLETYFANNLDEVDKDLHEAFEKWMSKRGAKL